MNFLYFSNSAGVEGRGPANDAIVHRAATQDLLVTATVATALFTFHFSIYTIYIQLQCLNNNKKLGSGCMKNLKENLSKIKLKNHMLFVYLASLAKCY